MKMFFFIFFGFVFLVMPRGAVSALGIAPTVLEFDLAPGESQERTVIIANESVAPARITPTVFRVTATDNNGFPTVEALGKSDPLANMISFPWGASYDLAIGEKRTIPIRVSLDTKAQPGGAYAVVSWKIEDRKEDVALSGQPGVNIAITIQGEVKEGFQIISFGLAKGKRVAVGRPIRFMATFANTGGRHVAPQGVVEIYTLFRTRAATFALETGRILPEMKRTLNAQWNDMWMFGPYWATLSVEGMGMASQTAETMFVAASPFALLVCFLVIALLAAIWFRLVISRSKK